MEPHEASTLIEAQGKELEDDEVHEDYVLNKLVPFRESQEELYLSCD